MKRAKSIDVLIKFIAYCIENPEQRFWQALGNFVGGKHITVNGEDTFYWESKNK